MHHERINDSGGKLRLAVIGCGAVAERLHIPAALASDVFSLSHLVDKDETRLAALSRRSGNPRTSCDYRDIMDEFDAAIVATPNHLHAPMTVDLLNNGKHVLIEKPMALTAEECQGMISAARKNGRKLSVILAKRFFHAHRYVKDILDKGFIGEVRSFDFREGGYYWWPSTTLRPFLKNMGGGVWHDIGPHVVDLMLWWFGDYESAAYFDDSFGGVDANCLCEIKLKNGARGVIELSRTRVLRKTYRINGTKGSLEVGAQWANPPVKISCETPMFLEGRVCMEHAPPQNDYTFIVKELIEDFGRAIVQNAEPYISGEDGMRSVAAIEACFNNRKPLEQPWMTP